MGYIPGKNSTLVLAVWIPYKSYQTQRIRCIVLEKATRLGLVCLIEEKLLATTAPLRSHLSSRCLRLSLRSMHCLTPSPLPTFVPQAMPLLLETPEEPLSSEKRRHVAPLFAFGGTPPAELEAETLAKIDRRPLGVSAAFCRCSVSNRFIVVVRRGILVLGDIISSSKYLCRNRERRKQTEMPCRR